MENAKLTSPKRQQQREKAWKGELKLKDRYEGMKHYLELETVETVIENNRDMEHLEPDYWGY